MSTHESIVPPEQIDKFGRALHDLAKLRDSSVDKALSKFEGDHKRLQGANLDKQVARAESFGFKYGKFSSGNSQGISVLFAEATSLDHEYTLLGSVELYPDRPIQVTKCMGDNQFLTEELAAHCFTPGADGSPAHLKDDVDSHIALLMWAIEQGAAQLGPEQ